MRSVASVQAEAGKGLVGDRYHGSRVRNVTVQSLEELEEAARLHARAIDPGRTRRNVTLSAGRLTRTPGHRFRIGEIELEVVRDAAPCKLLDDAFGRDVRLALARRAGVVCRITSGGELRVGDRAQLQASPARPLSDGSPIRAAIDATSPASREDAEPERDE